MRYLAEAGLLPRLAAISAVSGGSIAAAAAADRWDKVEAGGSTLETFVKEVDQPFRSYVTGHDIRNSWLLHIPWGAVRGRGRGEVMAETLAKALYPDRRVRDLPAGPQAIFTSTDLGTGRAMRFSRDFIGSYDFGYVDPTPETVDLATAVAASAAVPLMFPPVVVPTAGLGLTEAPDELSLVDGGVYDNLGYEWFMGDEKRRPEKFVKPDFLIVVNASGPFHREDKTYRGIRGPNRSRAVQYSQTINLRTRWFVNELRLKRQTGVYVGITRDPRNFTLEDEETPIASELYSGALPSKLIPPLADLRTDLNRFLPEEAGLLSYHGYWSLHARLGSFHPEFAVKQPQWTEYADISPKAVASLERLLRTGKYRLRGWGKLRARLGKKR